MSIGITPNKEDGKCIVCGEEKKVRVIFNTETEESFKICADCAQESKLTLEEGLEKYGKTN